MCVQYNTVSIHSSCTQWIPLGIDVQLEIMGVFIMMIAGYNLVLISTTPKKSGGCISCSYLLLGHPVLADTVVEVLTEGSERNILTSHENIFKGRLSP